MQNRGQLNVNDNPKESKASGNEYVIFICMRTVTNFKNNFHTSVSTKLEFQQSFLFSSSNLNLMCKLH